MSTFCRAEQMDRAVAQELEVCKNEVIVHRHINAPGKREARSEQRREWAQKGSRERQANVDLYYDLEKEYSALKASVTESNAHSKVLKADLTRTKEQLGSTRTPALENQKATLQARITEEVDKRRVWNADMKDIKVRMDILGSGPLNGVPKARFKSKTVEKDPETPSTHLQGSYFLQCPSPIIAHQQFY